MISWSLSTFHEVQMKTATGVEKEEGKFEDSFV
jgi:hypothetical protein